MKRRFNNKGFTLVELLVVIAIIGILASVVLVSLNTARSKSRDARRIADLRQTSLALENYYDDNIAYPALTSSLSPTYITVVPRDPQTDAAYPYNSSGCPSANQEYVLAATLENGTNPALDTDVDVATCTVTCTDPIYCINP